MRLLLVTTDPSLGVALAFDDPDREVVVAGSVGDARQRDPGSFDASVVDVGSTARGVRIADVFRELGLAHVLVIAERGEPVPVGSRYRYLRRPFTITELDTALAEFAPRGFGRRPRQTPRRRFLGRLFETRGPTSTAARPWETSGSHPKGDEEGRPGWPPEESEAAEVLPRRDGPVADALPPERVLRARELSELLGAVTRIENKIEERSHLSDLHGSALFVTGRLSDALAAARIDVWMHMPDGSHVLLPTRGLGGDAPTRLAPGHPLLDLLAGSADAVRIDRQRHLWLEGVADGVGDQDAVAIAAALRIGDRYHGSVVAFGRGFTTRDRDHLADLAWEAAPELALAAALHRLGVGGRLFTIPELEDAAPR